MAHPDLLQFAGEVSIQAAADGSKTPRVNIVGYTGGLMSIPGWGNIAVDLQGLDASGQIAILADHDASLPGIVGHGTARIVGNQLLVSGELPQVTDAAKQIVELAKGGFAFQASVGVQPITRERIEAGASVTINSQTLTAGGTGLTLIRSGKLKEISIVALGADGNTSVSVAASLKGKKMTLSTSETSGDIKAAWDQPGLTETERVLARWNGMTFNDSNIRQQTERFLNAALGGSLTFADFERELLQARVRDLELKNIRADRPNAPAIQTSERNITESTLEAALLCHLGHENVSAKMLGDAVTQGARNLGLHSVHDIMRASLQHDGVATPIGRNEMIRAAFSTNSVAGILGNVANKISLEAYRAIPSVARVISKKLTANDFKTHTGYRLTGNATFEEVGNGGEIRHGTLGEASFSYKVATFAKMFGLTRQDIINDDLGKFEEVPRLLGRGSAMKLEQLFWTLVLANTGNFFHADNGNFITGAGSVLSITSLAAAVSALRQLVDANGDPISVLPKYLVVPPELEAIADQLFASTNIVYGGDTAVPDSNPFKGKYQPQVSPYLSNVNYAGNSATGWYLFGDPADVAAFGIAYLSGQENPTIEQAETDFDTLGIQFRGYHDFGVCQVDHSGAVKSKGAT
jgi:hypothetical protein